MKKIFITGSSGFLGTALCKELKARNNIVTETNSKNCNLLNKNSLLTFNQEKYDEIYHLAAWTQAGDFCLKFPGEQWISNQFINTHVLYWWMKYQPQAKLVFMGTSCAYATDSSLKELEYMNGEPTESLYTYAMTKRMLYQGVKSISMQYGLKYLCAVPSTLYGPNYHTDGRQMHFIFDLIRKIIRGKVFRDQVILWGDGNQKRELVHVDDFVEILLALNDDFHNDIFNIGAGRDYSIKSFAELICNYVGYDSSKILYDTTKYVGAQSKCLNIDKLKTAMPDFKMVGLEKGLEQTINWFFQTESY